MKKETIEEYLARGGEITKVPEHKPEEPKKEITCRSTSKTPHKPMHITEGAVYWGEDRKRKTTKTKKFTGDVDALPSELVEFMKKKGQL